MMTVLRVDLVTTEAGFQSLAQEWRDLFCRCSDATYYLSWEFSSARWKYFAGGRRLWILTARDDEGSLVGIAPFAIAPMSAGPLKARRLEFLCRVEIPFRFERYFLDGEALDIIALPTYRDEVAAAFATYLHKSRASWDLIDLCWLSPDSSLRRHFTYTQRPRLERTAECAIATLPGDWLTYEQAALGKSESKRLRRFARKLERDYPDQTELVSITERDQVAPAMDLLDKMKLRRWQELGEFAPDDNAPHVQLHQQFDRDFATAAFDRGWLRFYQLRVNGEVIAAIHCIVVNGTDHLINKGFDPAWKRFSPGNVLQAYEIEHAIGEGVGSYDFGHGWVEAKRMWSNAYREDVRLVASTSWKGALIVIREMAGTTAGSLARWLARRLLSEETRTSLRRAVSNRMRRMQGSNDPDDVEH